MINKDRWKNHRYETGESQLIIFISGVNRLAKFC